MKYIPISELDETTSASDTDLIAIDNGSKTSKITVANYNSNANATAKSYAEASAASASEAATSVENATIQAESAQASASAASESATAASASKDSASEYATNAATQADNAESYASEASTSANNASTSATNANDYAITSKSWAVGGTSTRDGEDTNNAKYWSQVAAGAAAGGVVTFNGRNGAVVPQSGDYSASLISRGTSDVGTDLTKIETDLSSEVSRAKAAEASNTSAIANESTRAKAAEASNTSAIANESTRAKAAEASNTSAIANESTRAKAAEANLSSELNDQIYLINTGIYIRVKTGKNLGNGLTSQQAEKISDGDFYGLNIGDYWEANGNKFRIWHPNWYMNRGDQKFTKNHLVIMPDANILKADGSTTHYMNNTDTTSGGYAGTKYRSTYKSQCLKAFTDVFGTDHIAKYRGLLSNAVASGMVSGWAWYDCDAELPSEEMMFGAHHWSTSTDSGSSGYNGGSFWGQLALAIIAPEFVVNGENYFEQDVGTAAWFAVVVNDGGAAGSASAPWVGGRPFALLI
jgi:hypothetical protein